MKGEGHTILDRNSFAIRNISLRGSGIVFVFSLATGIGAFGTRNPKIAASGVENDFEGLSRSSEGNGADVFDVIVVFKSKRERCKK